MGIMDKLKGIVGGDPHDETKRASGAPDDEYLGTQLATPGADADVSSTEPDPLATGVGLPGMQPSFKPAEVQRKPNPEKRRE